MSQGPKTPPQQVGTLSGLQTPSGTPQKGIPAPAVPTLTAALAQGLGSDPQIHNVVTQLQAVQGMTSGFATSNLTTGLVAPSNEYPFSFIIPLGKLRDGCAPQKMDLKKVAGIKEYTDNWARVMVKDLYATVHPFGKAATHMVTVYVMWIPAGSAKPSSSYEMGDYAGCSEFSFGGGATMGTKYNVPCPTDQGIQPVLEAPLPFVNTPALIFSAPSFYSLIDGEKWEPEVGGGEHFFRIRVHGTLVYESKKPTKFAHTVVLD